jgi:integration host factor subunit beta
MTYTKRDIVRRISESKNLPMVQVEPWVDDVITALRETMMDANPTCRIEIRDFGVFEVKITKAKPKARNPKPMKSFTCLSIVRPTSNPVNC